MNKKAVSVMIGYILLVAAAVVMGTITYQWLISYAPSEGIGCPDDVSVFIKKYSCDATNHIFNFTLKNNGKFSVAGYFIHISNTTTEGLAETDLSSYIVLGGVNAANSIIYVSESDNTLTPGSEKESSFDLTGLGLNYINITEIIPARYQEYDKKLKFASCGGSKIKEELTSCVI